MNATELKIFGLAGIKEVAYGDRIGSLIREAAAASLVPILEGDVVVVAQKIVSKSEGRTCDLSHVQPSSVAREWGHSFNKDPRLIEVILNETRRIVRMDRGVLIVETRHGFVCANAGVDTSNVAPGVVTLLPADPDESAGRIREEIQAALGVKVAVILSDTFGRPWREGLVNVALGVAGMESLCDYRGQLDRSGQTLRSTVMAVADELASAAELVMGKTRGIPAALIRGFAYVEARGSARQLLRESEKDLFR